MFFKLAKKINPKSIKYQRKIAERLKEAEKDNQQIYHDRVPSGPDLSAVPMKQAVKLLPFQPRQPARHLFTNLVPAQSNRSYAFLQLRCPQSSYNYFQKGGDHSCGDFFMGVMEFFQSHSKGKLKAFMRIRMIL